MEIIDWTALVSGGAFLAFFAAVWIGTLTLVARFSGWNNIAQAMPPGFGPSVVSSDEKHFRFLTARIGSSNYKGCITVRTSRYGLSLGLMKIFNFPWTTMILDRYKTGAEATVCQ